MSRSTLPYRALLYSAVVSSVSLTRDTALYNACSLADPRIEHVQLLLSNSQDVTNSSIQYYKMLLRVIFDKDPIIAQTSKTTDGQITTSLTPNYLCLQCSAILPEEERAKHGNKKSHRFCR